MRIFRFVIDDAILVTAVRWGVFVCGEVELDGMGWE
jgi:hypothetical protein